MHQLAGILTSREQTTSNPRQTLYVNQQTLPTSASSRPRTPEHRAYNDMLIRNTSTHRFNKFHPSNPYDILLHHLARITKTKPSTSSDSYCLVELSCDTLSMIEGLSNRRCPSRVTELDSPSLPSFYIIPHHSTPRTNSNLRERKLIFP